MEDGFLGLLEFDMEEPATSKRAHRGLYSVALAADDTNLDTAIWSFRVCFRDLLWAQFLI